MSKNEIKRAHVVGHGTVERDALAYQMEAHYRFRVSVASTTTENKRRIHFHNT